MQMSNFRTSCGPG